MSVLGGIGNFLSGGVKDVLGAIGKIIDDSTLSPEEKAEMKLAWAMHAMESNRSWSPHAFMSMAVVGSTMYSLQMIDNGTGSWTEVTMVIRLLLLSALVGLEIGKIKSTAKDVRPIVRGEKL